MEIIPKIGRIGFSPREYHGELIEKTGSYVNALGQRFNEYIIQPSVQVTLEGKKLATDHAAIMTHILAW